MSKQTVICACGQRLIERVDFITPAYIITFADPASTKLVIACPSCGKALFPLYRDGELKLAP